MSAALARAIRISARGFRFLLIDHLQHCRHCDKRECSKAVQIRADMTAAQEREARELPVIQLPRQRRAA